MTRKNRALDAQDIIGLMRAALTALEGVADGLPDSQSRIERLRSELQQLEREISGRNDDEP